MAIHIENDLTVQASPEEVWEFLLDPERVAPCMPGAELTEVVDDEHYKGKVHIKMGPVNLSFNGDVAIEERDDAAKRMVMKAKGSEQKGKGQATATVTSQLQPSGNGTKMHITQDIDVSGALAQFGRGMIQDVTGSLMNQFAAGIEGELAGSGDGAAAKQGAKPKAAGAPKALSGISLGIMAVKSFVRRFFKNIFDFGDTVY
jgi:carbon monoxide dehydrogenase subunit G